MQPLSSRGLLARLASNPRRNKTAWHMTLLKLTKCCDVVNEQKAACCWRVDA